MGAPTGTVTPLRAKPWRGYPSVNAVHGIRAHVNQDATKYASTSGLVPAVAPAGGQFALTAGTPVHIGTIPAGALILPLTKHVIVGFLPMTTAVIDIGVKDAAGTFTGGLLSASDVATLGFTASISTGALIGYTAVTLELFIRLTITGATPTVGEVDVLIPFYIQKD
jgi:hypothetical protein